MPPLVEIEVVAFEGFLVRRRVVDAVGLPDPAFFIFYDDADFALRARQAGFRIWAVRDAVLVRQLAFSQQHALDSWKGYYMYRNLFVVHFRHGENALVRAKPYAITAAVIALSPVRGGRAEARNVIRAIRDARARESRPAARNRGGPPLLGRLGRVFRQPVNWLRSSQECPSCPTFPTSSSSAAGSSASPSPSAARPSST